MKDSITNKNNTEREKGLSMLENTWSGKIKKGNVFYITLPFFNIIGI